MHPIRSLNQAVNRQIDATSWRDLAAIGLGLPSLETGYLAGKLVREGESAKVKTVKAFIGLAATGALFLAEPVSTSISLSEWAAILPFASNLSSFLLTKPRPAYEDEVRSARAGVAASRYRES